MVVKENCLGDRGEARIVVVVIAKQQNYVGANSSRGVGGRRGVRGGDGSGKRELWLWEWCWVL